MASSSQNTESFGYFLRELKQQQKQTAGSQSEDDQEINLLRFIKVFSPPVEKIMEFSRAELDLSLMTVTRVLDKLEKDKQIEIREDNLGQRVVRITEEGLARL